MKRNRFYIVLLILAFLSFHQVYSQTDTITTTKAEPDSIDVKYDRVYKLFVEENQQEIKHLFKLDLVLIGLLRPTLAYEQKMGKNFSFEANLILSYRHLVYDTNNSSKLWASYQFNNSDLQSIRVGSYQMVKVYYNYKRRERLGKNTNGFSGNYFALKLSESYILIDNFYSKESSSNNYPEHIYSVFPGITYGIQRRIGNIGYGEFSMDFYFRELAIRSDNTDFPDLNLGLSLKLGFAIESISSLKHMLKK